MPPGPVGVTAIRFGLYDEVKPGVFLAMGTALLDMVFCLLAIFATSAATAAISGFSEEHPIIMLVLQILFVAGFVAYGIFNLRSRNEKIDPENDKSKKKEHSKFIENLMTKGPFFLGVAIALTNIPNPTFLPSLAIITTYVHSLNLIDNSTLANSLFAVGFGFGNFLWLYTLIRLVMHFKTKMSSMMITRIRQFTGFTLIGFGTFLGYRLVTVTHWSELLRIVFAI